MIKPDEIIQTLVQYKGMTYKSFAESIGAIAQNLYDIKGGKSDISKKMADKILAVYPEINRTWLLTGEGKMISENDTPEDEDFVLDPRSEYITNKDLHNSIGEISEKIDSINEKFDRVIDKLDELYKK